QQVFQLIEKTLLVLAGKSDGWGRHGKSFLDDDFPQYSQTGRPIHHGDTEEARLKSCQRLRSTGLCGHKKFSQCLRASVVNPLSQVPNREGEKSVRFCESGSRSMSEVMTFAVIGASRMPSR